MIPLAIPTLQHVAELGVFLLLAAVGVGLFAALIIGLLLIWGKVGDEPDAIHEEYRQVEEAGAAIPPLAREEIQHWLQLPQTRTTIARVAGEFALHPQPRPYNWATREPMVWTRPNV